MNNIKMCLLVDSLHAFKKPKLLVRINTFEEV